MALNDYMPVLSTVTLPSGSTYYLKDGYAREQLEAIVPIIEDLVNYSKFLGVTTTELENGSTTNPIVIDGEDVEADNGDIVIFGSKEFIFNGTTWAEFGDLDAIIHMLKDLAYADTASASYTPEGEVTINPISGSVSSTGTAAGDIDAHFTGTEGNVNVEGTVASSEVVISSTAGTATYTPEGSVSAPKFNGNQSSIAINFTPDGSIDVTFDGTEGDIIVTGTTAGTVQIGNIIKSLTGNYTPTGTIRNTEITVTKTPGVAATVTSSGVAPSITNGLVSFAVTDENLNISDITATAWNAGTMPSFGTVSVLTDVSAAFTSTPEFVGDTVLISATFTGSSMTASGKFTPSGSVSGSFTGTSATLSSTFTPAGSVTAPEFNGTPTRLVGTVASASVTASGKFTPNGSISGTFSGTVETSGAFTNVSASASFTGSTSTITVYPD